mgnify:FL=1|tara:strand:+ start:21 stop:845 length:825 start_codon:yes stop_codon:yes gene_type:complete
MNLALAQSSELDDESRRDEARQLRGRIRRGEHDGLTTGLAPGMVQLNLAILPQDWAEDFQRFCELNPKPCPLVSMTDPGNPVFPSEIGDDIDVRTDAPRYLVFRNGVLADEITDLGDIWQDDFVAFGMGCSYSFEEALVAGGLSLRHIEQGTKVPLYISNLETTPAGPFKGPTILSMRPFLPDDAIRAIEITARYPRVHGTPVHFGNPKMIGIDDIMQPYSGVSPVMRENEEPVFWACGVTPQVIVQHAKPPICITHKPGHMLITDRLNTELAD